MSELGNPGTSIICDDGAGEIAVIASEDVFDFSVAPDGAIWGAGEQIARLAEHLPTR